jgi:hypothetical protein
MSIAEPRIVAISWYSLYEASTGQEQSGGVDRRAPPGSTASKRITGARRVGRAVMALNHMPTTLPRVEQATEARTAIAITARVRRFQITLHRHQYAENGWRFRLP